MSTRPAGREVSVLHHAPPDTPDEFQRELVFPAFPDISDGYLPDNVTVHFHFGKHGTVAHFADTRPLLDEADIYIPELSAWDEKGLYLYRAISKGDRKKYAEGVNLYRDKPHRLALLAAIHGTYKPILFIDAKAGQAGALADKDTTRLGMKVVDASSYELALQAAANLQAEVAQSAILRDRIMVGNMGSSVTDLVSRHPRLRGKETVSVLATLGAAHIAVYDTLKTAPATQNQVTVSGNLDALSDDRNAVYNYMKGETPTRENLTRFFLGIALRAITIPEIRTAPPILELILQDMQDEHVQSAVFNAMKGWDSKEDRGLFIQYAQKAEELSGTQT